MNFDWAIGYVFGLATMAGINAMNNWTTRQRDKELAREFEISQLRNQIEKLKKEPK